MDSDQNIRELQVPETPHYQSHPRRASVAYRAVRRFENVARRMSTPTFSIERIKEDLEKEIVEDETEPKNLCEKFRKSGEKILHSKKVLIFIVILNIVDCILVLGELILDIIFIKEMVDAGKDLIYKLIEMLIDRFPGMYGDLTRTDVAKAFNRFVSTSLYAMSPSNQTVHLHYADRMYTAEDDSYGGVDEPFTETEVPKFLDENHEHTDIETIAHTLHKISITIVGILVIFVMLKVFCYGTKIFKKKFELFDGIIVIASFAIDIAFIKGMMVYPLEEAVEILAFLIPWRVIRVANSLVAAVLDQAHLQLKTVYKDKKSCEEELQFSKSKNLYHQSAMTALRELCEEKGIAPSLIKERIAMCGMPEPKQKKNKGSFKEKVLSFKSRMRFKDARKEINGNNMPSIVRTSTQNSEDNHVDNEIDWETTFDDTFENEGEVNSPCLDNGSVRRYNEH